MLGNDLEHIKTRLVHRSRGILGEEDIVPAGLLLPLIQKEGEVHILFEVRALHMKAQPGDICFPGGRVERTDATMEDTAIRETCEELGITSRDIEVIAPLDVLVARHGAILYPFVGIVDEQTTLRPDPAEVEEVFSVPLSYFLSARPQRYDITLDVRPPEDFPYHLIVGGKNYNWRSASIAEYFYVYEDYVIWGMTAKILHHFIRLIRGKED